MNTKILVGIIITVLIVIVGVFILWYIPTHKCPESCDDKDVCTEDFCSKETNYKCSYSIIPNCCGNEICESGEFYENCPADCPNCDDSNECTKDSYDYHEQKCLNASILTTICCGNTVCETGETYINCSRDCPNCDDENKCTKDSYDYYQKECLNKVIIPCCGNRICDKGVEARSNCSADCPSCDDNNRLTADTFNYTTQKCENIVTHYFLDDFEQGAENWSWGAAPEDPTASWSIATEGNNKVFKGIGHNWSDLIVGKEWNNYVFKAKFKVIIEGNGIHLNYRNIGGEQGQARYFIWVDNNNLSLSKQRGENFYILIDPPVGLNLAAGWHTFEIRGYGNILNIYIDNVLLIKYKDTSNPVLSGSVALETLNNSEFLIDDVEIKVISQQDVIYP